MTSSRGLAFAAALAASMALAGAGAGDARAQAPPTGQPSATDLETARALYNQGKDLRARGDLAGALEKLRVAHELGRTPITGIELARTHEAMGHLVEAREVCLGIARMPVAGDETERSIAARRDAAKLADDLKPRIPSLGIELEGVPTGHSPVVMIDRVVVPNDTLHEPRKMNPGKHEVVAKMPRGPEASAMIDLAEGQTRTVNLRVPPEAAGTEALPPGAVVISPPPGQVPARQGGPQGEQPRRAHHGGANGLAIAGFVVGGAGVAIGAVTGLVALSKASDLEKKCPDKECPLDAQGDRKSAVAYANVSTVAFVIGGIGIGTAIIALATSGKSSDEPSEAKRRRVEPYLAPGGAGVRGAF